MLMYLCAIKTTQSTWGEVGRQVRVPVLIFQHVLNRVVLYKLTLHPKMIAILDCCILEQQLANSLNMSLRLPLYYSCV